KYPSVSLYCTTVFSFFFSSRRRHTRSKRDWSSDVCSSDLTPGDTGYRWLFDGTAESLDGWSQAPGGHFDLLPNGSLLTQGGMGMLWYEAEEFEDFSLKLEFRDVAEGDD